MKGSDLLMWLFLIFVAVPIVEIGLFIQVGGAIGLWPTLAVVILTAFVGTNLMRRQGIMTLNRLQNALAEGGNPADPMAQGAMILVAGVLLLTPGFFTDALGFALLLPPVRALIVKYVAARVASGNFTFSQPVHSTSAARPNSASQSQTIDGEYAILDDKDATPPEKPSGWTNH